MAASSVGLAPPELGGGRGLARPLRSSASRARASVRPGCTDDQRFEREALGGGVAGLAGQPGAKLEDPRGIGLASRQVRHGLSGRFRPAGGDGPVQPGLPEDRVIGSGADPLAEQAIGTVEVAGAGRQVGASDRQRLAVVGTGRARGLLEDREVELQRERLEFQPDVLAE